MHQIALLDTLDTMLLIQSRFVFVDNDYQGEPAFHRRLDTSGFLIYSAFRVVDLHPSDSWGCSRTWPENCECVTSTFVVRGFK